MPRTSLQKIRLPKSLRAHTLPPVHHLHTSLPCHSTITLPLAESWASSASSHDFRANIQEQKFREIRTILSRKSPRHNHVWGMYVDLMHVYDAEQVPLDIHQAVLRQCTIPARQMRAVKAKQMAAGRRSLEKHVHETRFQAVIRNIRAGGHEPTLDDYHFVLEQFASVGHTQGAMMVMEEISKLGLRKTPKTYGLCLQAICHHLSLPCWHLRRPHIVSDMTRLCYSLIEDMAAQDLAFTSVNMDLVLRILKETQDLEGFSRLMKTAYGIDLAYPDRPPLEQWDKPEQSNDALPQSVIKNPLPFSTAALNTAVDMLGRLGEISKLVQTFEVLTTPLPSQSTPSTPSFDEDDDDDYSYSTPVVSSYRHPHAEPNTTTYRMLLKWVSRADSAVLARHYLLQAMALDRQIAHKLQMDVAQKPVSQIMAPSFTVNRSLILPVFSLANRNKNMELLRWVSYRLRNVLKSKRSSLATHEYRQRQWRTAIEEAENVARDTAKATTERQAASDLSEPSATSVDPAFQTFFSPSSSPSEDAATKATVIQPTSYFDVDLDSTVQPSPVPPRPFDINVHVSILRRDIEELEELEKRVTLVVGRTVQRIKERLGRRVWDGKDVFMRKEDRRVVVGRETWRTIVHFRPGRADSAHHTVRIARDAVPHLRPGYIAATQGLGPMHLKHANDPPQTESS